jgi:hypothetical protein
MLRPTRSTVSKDGRLIAGDGGGGHGFGGAAAEGCRTTGKLSIASAMITA